jgi:hypothetical protein
MHRRPEVREHLAELKQDEVAVAPQGRRHAANKTWTLVSGQE